jgi:hypothetical protein
MLVGAWQPPVTDLLHSNFPLVFIM